MDLAIVDLDGTLVRLHIDWKSVEKLIQEISKGSTKTFLGFVARYWGSPVFWKIHSAVEEMELRAVESMEVLDDAPTFIRILKSMARIAIVTMQSRRACIEALKKLGVADTVDAVITREDCSTRFEQIARALKMFSPDRAVLIADKVLDAFAAYANRVKPIIVVRETRCVEPWWGDNIFEDLEVIGAEIVSSLGEAIEVIKRIWSR